MSTATQPVPAQIDRLQRTAFGVGVLGLAACGVGAFTNPDQLLRSWLIAFLFWVGVGVGCMSLCMIHHLSGGMWGLVIRRILEAGIRTLRYAWVLFLPLAFALPKLYVWAQPEKVAADHVLQHKSLYLNTPFFLGRTAFYFLVWIVLGYFLNKWSLEQDERRGDVRLARRMRGLSGGGLVLMGLTITFASVDWAMSLDPHWFSTIYGVLFMVGQALSAMALMIVMVALLGDEPPLASVVSPQSVHDLGKLLFAFVMLWAYVSLSQFLIVWSGNLPEEIPWYIHRLHGGWEWIALILVVFHFVLPFMLLLSRDLKRNPPVLGAVAAALFVVRLADLFWLVAPELKGHGSLVIHWLDVAAPVGVGGIWLAVFAWQLKGRPLLAAGDPELIEALEGQAH